MTKGIVSLENVESKIGMLCKEITLSPDELTANYWFNFPSSSKDVIERLYLDHCKIEMMADKMFSYLIMHRQVYQNCWLSLVILQCRLHRQLLKLLIS